MHLLSVMRSSLVMQISSIAFRASLRDINKAKPTAASAKSSSGGASSAFSPSALSAMDDRAEQIYYTCLDSALNLLVHTMQMPPSILRHAQDMIMVLAPHAALLATYLISLPLPSVPPNFASSAAASERLGYEYAKVKTRIRRRKEYERKCLELMRDTRESFRLAQVRADDHVGLCAQYFDSLLNVIEGEAAESNGNATVPAPATSCAARPGRSLLSNTSVLAGTKRSRSTLDAQRSGQDDVESAIPRGLTQTASSENALARASSAGPTPSSRGPPQHEAQMSSSQAQSLRHHTQHRHHPNPSNTDTSAAETLLNLHSESQPLGASSSTAADGEAAAIAAHGPAGESSSSPVGARMFNGAPYYPSAGTHHLSHSRIGGQQHSASTPPSSSSVSAATGGPFSPGSFISTGMFGHFAPTSSSTSIPNSPQHTGYHPHHHHHPAHPHHPGAGAGGYVPHPTNAGEFGFAPGVLAPPGGTVTPTGAGGPGTGTSTPVDWTWLQSFLEVPEFSWM